MPEIFIKIKNKPKKDDILVFDGEDYKNTDLKGILKPYNDFINELQNRLCMDESDIKELKIEVEKLKEDIKYLKGE